MKLNDKRTKEASLDVNRLLFFALKRLHQDKSETEIVNMLDIARKALSKL